MSLKSDMDKSMMECIKRLARMDDWALIETALVAIKELKERDLIDKLETDLPKSLFEKVKGFLFR